MEKNQKEEQKSVNCELKKWGSRLDTHCSHWSARKGVWRDRKRTSEQEGTLSYPGPQSLGLLHRK